MVRLGQGGAGHESIYSCLRRSAYTPSCLHHLNVRSVLASTMYVCVRLTAVQVAPRILSLAFVLCSRTRLPRLASFQACTHPSAADHLTEEVTSLDQPAALAGVVGVVALQTV